MEFPRNRGSATEGSSGSGSESISVGRFFLVVLLLTGSLAYLVVVNNNLRSDIIALRETEEANLKLHSQYNTYSSKYTSASQGRNLQTGGSGSGTSAGSSELPGLVTATIFEQDSEINLMKKEIELLRRQLEASGQIVSSDKTEVEIYSYVNPNNGNTTLHVKSAGQDSHNILLDTSSTSTEKAPNFILGGEAQNVGVGLKDPKARLHVEGNIKGSKIHVDGVASVASALNANTLSSGALEVTNTDKVGIGIEAPQSTLHVAGNLKSEGDFSSEEISVRHTLRVLESADLGQAVLSKAALIGSVKVDPIETSYKKVLIDKNGKVLINKDIGDPSNDLEVGGTVRTSDVKIKVAEKTVLGNVIINKDGKVGLNQEPSSVDILSLSGDFGLKGDLAVNLDSTAKIGNLVIDSNSVGINTGHANAASGLDVNGNVQLDHNLKVSVLGKSTIGGLTVSQLKKAAIGTDVSSTADLVVGGNVQVIGDLTNTPTALSSIGALNLKADGKVGVGKVPTSKGLEVEGDVHAFSDMFLEVKAQSTIGNVQLKSDGTVGIGKVSAGDALEVDGNTQVFSDIFVDTDTGSNIGELRFTSNQVGIAKTAVKDFDVEGNVHIREGITVRVDSVGSNFASIRIDTMGKVGINQAPGLNNRLEVTGNAYVKKDLYVRTLTKSDIGPIQNLNSGLVGIGGTPVSEVLEITGSMTGDSDIFAVGSTESKIGTLVMRDKLVGVGVANPTSTLDVSGVVATTGDVHIHMNERETSDIFPMRIVKKDLYSRIGINKLDPDYELDVIGSARFEGNFFVDNYKTSKVKNVLFLENGVGVGVGSTMKGYELNVEGNTKVSGEAVFMGDSRIGEVYSKKPGATRKIGVGYTAPTHELDVFGRATLASGTFNLPVPSGNSYLGPIRFGGSSSASASNIAINKALDANELSVDGNLVATGSFTSDSGLLSRLSLPVSTQVNMKIFQTGNVAIGNVGTVPSDKLAVAGKILMSGDSSVVINGELHANDFTFGPTAGKYVEFQQSLTAQSTFEANGQLVLGATTAAGAAQLEVHGKASVQLNLASSSANFNGFQFEDGPGTVKLWASGNLAVNTNSNPATEKVFVNGKVQSNTLNVVQATTVSAVQFESLSSGNPVRWDGKTLVVNSASAQTDQNKLLDVIGKVEGDNLQVSRSTAGINNFGGVKISATSSFLSVGTPSTYDNTNVLKASHASKIFQVNNNANVLSTSALDLAGVITHDDSVGIGIGQTGSNQKILSLTGNLRSSQDICVRGKCLNSWVYFNYLSSSTSRYVGRDASGNNHILADGKFGVGKDAASISEALDIEGNLKVITTRGDLRADICSSNSALKCASDFITIWNNPVNNIYEAKTTTNNIFFDKNGRFLINSPSSQFSSFEANQAASVNGQIKASVDIETDTGISLDNTGFFAAIGGYKLEDLYITNSGLMSIGRTLPQYQLHASKKILSNSFVTETNSVSFTSNVDPRTFTPLRKISGGYNYVEDNDYMINKFGVIQDKTAASSADEVFRLPAGRKIQMKGLTSKACVGDDNHCLRSFYLPQYTASASEISYKPNFRIDLVTGLVNKPAGETTSYFEDWTTKSLYLHKDTTNNRATGDSCAESEVGLLKVNSQNDYLICLVIDDSVPAAIVRRLVALNNV